MLVLDNQYAHLRTKVQNNIHLDTRLTNIVCKLYITTNDVVKVMATHCDVLLSYFRAAWVL